MTVRQQKAAFGLVQEAEGCSRPLTNFGVVDCASRRAFGRSPLTYLWRIHHQQRLDLSGQSLSSRYLVIVPAVAAVAVAAVRHRPPNRC
jgi:hypothetical protein